jgi:hypothetical protein
VTQNVDTKILPDQTFFETYKKQTGEEFDHRKYAYLISRCRSLKLIKSDGTVIEKDVNKVVEVLR